jgi:hypothetical protein
MAREGTLVDSIWVGLFEFFTSSQSRSVCFEVLSLPLISSVSRWELRPGEPFLLSCACFVPVELDPA